MKTRHSICRVSLIFFLLVTTQIMAQAQSNVKQEAAIRAVLEAQKEAWNKGDIDGYMDGYERSENTVFVSGDSVSHGWQTVHDHYKKSYDTREKMGTLSFSDLEITMLGTDSAVVLGTWRLQRASDEPHGRFTLVFRLTKNGWRIIHDHTSTATK